MVVPDSPRNLRTHFLGDIVRVEVWVVRHSAEVQLLLEKIHSQNGEHEPNHQNHYSYVDNAAY